MKTSGLLSEKDWERVTWAGTVKLTYEDVGTADSGYSVLPQLWYVSNGGISQIMLGGHTHTRTLHI